jgi:hypothetical protein
MKPDNYLFTLDSQKETQNLSSQDVEYYTMLGDHDFIDDNQRPRAKKEKSGVVAKQITKNTNKKLYIKIGTYGKIFNPMGMFSEGKNEKFLAKIGRKEFEFKEVNQKVFDMYLNFLSSKNLAWLNNAEREMV